jgi:thiol-disulfide isomerase/thioredoxin
MRYVGWIGGFLLVAALAVPPAAAAGQGVCNVAARPANLNFTLTDVEGRRVRLVEYRGRVVLVNFWATWCAPCKKEIPWLNELHVRYREQGLVVIGVSVDDVVAKIRPFAQAMKMSYPALVGAGEDGFKESFGPLLGYPTTVLISRAGQICIRHVGITEKEQLERDVRALL